MPQSGAGPTLTIRAGNKLAWTNPDDYLLVNRGSRIIAEGTSVAPITLTGFNDAILDNAGKEDTQLWGGVVINGNGITNKCSDDDIEYYIRECGDILGVTQNVENPDDPKAILHYIFQEIVKYKSSNLS